MGAAAERDFYRVCLSAAITPVLKDKRAVDEQAHSVVVEHCEAIVASVEVQIARPAGGEIIGLNSRVWRIPIPFEVDCRVVSAKGG